jgi:hypothetical protein
MHSGFEEDLVSASGPWPTLNDDRDKLQTSVALPWLPNLPAYPLTLTPSLLAAFVTSSNRFRLSSMLQLMFFLLNASLAAPKMATVEALACGSTGALGVWK